MIRQFNPHLLQKIKDRFAFLQNSTEHESPRILMVISHHQNSWALNVVQGARTHFLNSLIPAPEMPELDVIQLSIEGGELSEQACHILKSNLHRYQAIATVGATVSVAMKSFVLANQIRLPLYCCGVKDPVEFGLISTLDAGRDENIGVVTGIANDYEQQVKTFTSVNPSVRKVLCAYYNTPLLKKVVEHDVAGMKKAFENNNVEVVTKELSIQDNILRQQIRDASKDVDAITLFRDIGVYNGVHSIIDECNKSDTIVFASELASLYAGAGIAFGDTGFEYGAKLGVLLEEFLYHHTPAYALPVSWVNEPGTLRVNDRIIGSQGLHLDERSLELIGNTALLRR